MKKKLLLLFVATALFTLAPQHGFAQFPIKIPKIKKDQPKPSTPEIPTAKQNTDSKAKVLTEDDPLPIFFQEHLKDIEKRQKEVESFTPSRGWFVSRSTDDHLLLALSPSKRQKWFDDSGISKAPEKNRSRISFALDKLAASAANKLPLYLPNTKAYALHNTAEEKLIKSKILRLEEHKVFYIGIQEPSWLIEKNDLGIPKSRYKHGIVWVRYVPNDHPYCRIYHINVIQDYAGGGTYGASYGYFVRDELAGCPAGIK